MNSGFPAFPATEPSLRCPLCDHTEVPTPFWDERDTPLNGTLSSRYFRCSRCSLVFLYPLPTREFLSSKYNLDYDYKLFLENERFKREQARHRLNAITGLLNHRPGGPRLLIDLGCGHGFFLHEASVKGWSGIGVETSDQPRGYATNTLGLKVLSTEFDRQQFEGECADAVTLWHVIEHIPDPMETIGHIRSVLKPGGVLAIACPNISSVSAKITKHEWLWLGFPFHLYQFSPKSLRTLLEKEGFEVKKIVTHETYDSNSLPVLLLWHYGTHIARSLGLRKVRHGATTSEGDKEISIYHPGGFSLSPLQLMAWLLRLVGNALSILCFPFIYASWKAGYGTEVEIYAVKKASHDLGTIRI